MKLAAVLAVAIAGLAPALACGLPSPDEFASGTERPGDGGLVDGAPVSDGASLVPLADGGAKDIGDGDGHFGDKSVSGDEILNGYAAIVAPTTAGAFTVEVDDPGPIRVGDAVMIWQTTTTDRIDSATTANIDAYDVGKYTLARVLTIAMPADDSGAKAELTLDRPLPFATKAPGAQAVLVPEYTSLDITGSVKALPWNGTRGGIFAVLVSGTLAVEGTLGADASGFRGGVSYANNNLFGCTDQLDGTPVNGYAAKGEGLVSTSYRASGVGDPSTAPGGRGNATVGGGGGSCHNAGGAGGGNGSAGGKGGREYDSAGAGADIGGIGGSAVSFKVAERLVLGGGGGAGDRHQTIDVSGGAGGGVIFARAGTLAVSGTITANGATTLETDHDGAGGGGAGGTIALFVTNAASCTGHLGAKGADGGSTTMSNVGPGGGGGGGHARLAAASATGCSFDVSSGVGGVQANASVEDGPRYGSEPTTKGAGVIEAP